MPTELRAKKLRPGGGSPDEETEASQRERIFGAMVATVAEKGYEATTVADISELFGVSKSSYYEHFKDKQAGFLATLEALVGPALEYAADAGLGGDEAEARRPSNAGSSWIVSQPAAAKTLPRRRSTRRARRGGDPRPHRGRPRAAAVTATFERIPGARRCRRRSCGR